MYLFIYISKHLFYLAKFPIFFIISYDNIDGIDISYQYLLYRDYVFLTNSSSHPPFIGFFSLFKIFFPIFRDIFSVGNPRNGFV